MYRHCLVGCASLAALAAAYPALGQSSPSPSPPTPAPQMAQAGAAAQSAQTTVTLPQIEVRRRVRRARSPSPPRTAAAPAPAIAAPAAAAGTLAGPAPVKQRYQLPQTSEGITAQRLEQTTNVIDSEDAVKYLPSLSLRKRNAGDNQTVLASRVWGLNSSARTLVYADDILISALIGNNNTNATPRWGMIAPEEIKRVDFLYGPFSAAYPGNSMGGVLLFTTRMPDKFEATVKQSESFQTFGFYNTAGTYKTDQTSASIGNRWGDFSAFVSVNYQNSYSQPLGWATTAAALPAGISGAIAQPSRAGGIANVIGATGLLHTEMTNAKGKFALDITPWLRATYTIGVWSNEQTSSVQSYLRDAAGNPTFGPQSTNNPFASGNFTLSQLNLANAFALKTDTGGAFEGDFVVTRYDYLEDIQRNPFNVTGTGLAFTNTGRIARLDGTNWTTVDAKGVRRFEGPAGKHELSFGYHFDTYALNNPVYRTTNFAGGPTATNELFTRGDGNTETHGLWMQDAWRFLPGWKLTLGGRWETWHAFNGFNLNTTQNQAGVITSTTTINQPELSALRFSPKAALAYEPNRDWELTSSFGVANRFPTVTELYQIATVNGVLINPNPNLKPERSHVSEVAAIRKFDDGRVRLSLFHEDTYGMLISQQSTLPGTTTLASFITNVDRVRNRGVELAWQKDNVGIRRLELFGSATYVDSEIVSDPTFAGTGGTAANGKRVPNVPMWRSTFGATYRPTDALAWTVAGRYQGKIFATLDNIDTVRNVFQAFDPYLVFDTRLVYLAGERGSLAVGIDNFTNEKYHLFHPFPQRTYVVQGRLKF